VSDLIDLMRERYKFAEVVYYHPKKAAFLINAGESD
jgi:hypothetical protein